MIRLGDHRLIHIAKTAVRKGHEVTHFTSTFRHTSKKQRFSEDRTLEVEPGYRIEYVKSKGYTKNISLKRISAHADFADKLVASFAGRDLPDVIFISMPPLSSAEKVILWANENGVPVITDIIDPWPDSFIKDVPTSLKPLSKLFIRPFYKKLRFILDQSTVVTSISNGYLDWAKENCSTIRKTECFYPAFDFASIQDSMDKHRKTEQRDENVLRVIYVGSLGSSYDLPAIVQAAEIMNRKYPGKTEFIVAGSGPQKEIVEEYAGRLQNLECRGWISDEELMRQYYLSDLGLIQHKNNLTQTVTYKLFSYLSAGLPILNSLQSEMADIVRENKVGFNNANGDVEGLVANIERFLDDRELLNRYKEKCTGVDARKGGFRGRIWKDAGSVCRCGG
ncbi:glycosyltransferase family 4 protein [Rhodohalobacter sp.]|uniref:glycosyltransferase family 4 protein n=1 Tax=Rhodohalobacter sp. TaxID=1974210 RepID=UPI002ACE2221|nr:glycosyltransferase family 4 protein [Rhodohalobacter sp.]MDZ7755202.1 glycosyltransferase family 4 protein [Rhodohalobacter sp.]